MMVEAYYMEHGCYEGLRVEPTTVTLRGGVKLQTVSLLPAPLPYSSKSQKNYWVATRGSRWKSASLQGPCTTTTMTTVRGSKD